IFLGQIKHINEFEKKCNLCGNCIIDKYDGLCPITRCPKNMLNGPCGGSAISGDIIQTLFINRLNIPIYVNRSYNLPKWANKNTLVITQSYSGNTEETLSAFKQAYQKKCKTISISSGGKLKEYCQNRGITHVKIPSGYVPRGAIAYFIFISLKILEKIGLTTNILKIDIEELIEIAEPPIPLKIILFILNILSICNLSTISIASFI
ncbi:unnamed protein product, partial [marine sediment metagenome]